MGDENGKIIMPMLTRSYCHFISYIYISVACVCVVPREVRSEHRSPGTGV